MEPPRILRLLRIAVSAMCVIACGLLITLWLRSYRWEDKVAISIYGGRDLSIYHAQGQLSFIVWTPGDFPKPLWSRSSQYLSPQALEFQRKFIPEYATSASGFGYQTLAGDPLVFMPYWSPVAVFAALAAVLGVRRPYNFSLRSLLIATTFVALLLGLIAVAIR